MQNQGLASDTAHAGLSMKTSHDSAQAAPALIYDLVCVDALGQEQWRESVHNTVLIAGKTDLVTKYLQGSAYTAAWYMLLVGTGTIATSDTLASHAGWSEVTPYAGNRPGITWGTTASGSNTGTAVTFSINASATVAGAGICTVNTGTAGVLYSAADFASPRTVASGDTLSVTPSISIS